MAKTVALKCDCGAVKGHLKIVKGSYFHVHCLCCDCQKFAAYMNNEAKILDTHGGTELFQTYPAFMAISEGKDNLACVQLKEKGLLRWHTTCCNMPVANTMTSPKVPFVGVSVKLMQFKSEEEKSEALGPVTLKAFGKYAIGKMPEDAHERFPITFMPKMIVFMLKGFLKKMSSPSPFFTDNKPCKEAVVLS